MVDSDGELVITGPIPAMPVALDGSRYRATWFRHLPWHLAPRRLDHTHQSRDGDHQWPLRCHLNRGGVRIGTAEFYAALDALPEVDDSLIVHLDDPSTGHGRLVLFVVARDPG